MPDENELPIATGDDLPPLETPAPENPPQPPNENVPGPSNEAPAQNVVVENLIRAGKAFRDAAGRAWLKVGGRPRKDGKAGSGDILLESPAAATGAKPDAPVAALADAAALPNSDALLRKAIVGAARSLFGILGDVIKIVGREPLGAEFCETVVAKAKPDPVVLDEWSESLETLLAKHNVKMENAPEWTFGLNTVRMLAPYGLILAEIRSELARKRSLQNQPLKK